MASLPKIRRTRVARRPVTPPQPERTTADVQRLEAFGLTWLNIESPKGVDAQWLAANYDFHELDLEDVLSRRQQRSKIDEYPDYLFIVLHFPRYDRQTKRLQAAELDVFMAEDLLITLPKDPLKPLSALWAQCEGREEDRARHMSKGAGYLLYEIVDRMYDYCFPILNKISHKLDQIEDEIFEGKSEAVVGEISNATQEIINYRKIIKPQRPTLRGLERATQRYAPEDLEIYFDDIVDKNERIWDLLENYKEVAEALEATNEAVITHRLNEVIRVLTILSALVLPLTLITGFYGMNVDGLFLAHHGGWSVMFTLGVMGLTGAGLLLWFRRKGWI